MPYTSPLTYKITDTAGDIVQVGLLQMQIEGWQPAPPTKAVDYIDANSHPVGEGAIDVHFVDTAPNAISDADKAIVDAVVASHAGLQAADYKAASKLVEEAKLDIVQDLTWQVLGGVVTNPSYFIPDIATAFGKIQCVEEAVGATAELRIMERNPADNTEVECCLVQIPEANDMQAFDFNTTTPPRVGVMEYRLEGRLNGATSASVGFVSMSLFKGYLEGIVPAT
jgi:hypothetical protein